MAVKSTTAFGRTGKAMPGAAKLGNSKSGRDGSSMGAASGSAPAFPTTRVRPNVQTPNTSHEVAFAKNLNGPLGKGYKHRGGTSGSESITKGGK